MKEKKFRVEDTIAATRAALESGVVAGGGLALLEASKVLEAIPSEISEDEKLYIFFCANSFVEIISFDPPIFTKVSSKEEFYESIKERVCWYPKEETDEQS